MIPIPLIMSAISFVETMLPEAIGVASKTGTLITLLENLAPIASKISMILYNRIKQIVATISADPATTPEQLVALKKIDAASDAAYDAADKPQPGDPDYVAP